MSDQYIYNYDQVYLDIYIAYSNNIEALRSKLHNKKISIEHYRSELNKIINKSKEIAIGENIDIFINTLAVKVKNETLESNSSSMRMYKNALKLALSNIEDLEYDYQGCTEHIKIKLNQNIDVYKKASRLYCTTSYILQNIINSTSNTMHKPPYVYNYPYIDRRTYSRNNLHSYPSLYYLYIKNLKTVNDLLNNVINTTLKIKYLNQIVVQIVDKKKWVINTGEIMSESITLMRKRNSVIKQIFIRLEMSNKIFNQLNTEIQTRIKKSDFTQKEKILSNIQKTINENKRVIGTINAKLKIMEEHIQINNEETLQKFQELKQWY